MLHLQTCIIYIYRCVMTSPICFSSYWMYICIITAVNRIWTIYMLIYDPNSQNPSAVTMVTDWCNCTCQVSNHSSSCLCRPCICVPAVTVMGVFRKQPPSSLAVVPYGCPGEAVIDSAVSEWWRLTDFCGLKWPTAVSLKVNECFYETAVTSLNA